MGWDDLSDPELPQTNPHDIPSLPPNRPLLEFSYLILNKDTLTIDVPVSATITSPEISLIASTSVAVGATGSDQYLALGTKLKDHLGTVGVIPSPMGPLSINPPPVTPATTTIPGWENLISDKHTVEDR